MTVNMPLSRWDRDLLVTQAVTSVAPLQRRAQRPVADLWVLVGRAGQVVGLRVGISLVGGSLRSDYEVASGVV